MSIDITTNDTLVQTAQDTRIRDMLNSLDINIDHAVNTTASATASGTQDIRLSNTTSSIPEEYWAPSRTGSPTVSGDLLVTGSTDIRTTNAWEQFTDNSMRDRYYTQATTTSLDLRDAYASGRELEELKDEVNRSNADIIKLRVSLDAEKKRNEEMRIEFEKMQSQLKMLLEV